MFISEIGLVSVVVRVLILRVFLRLIYSLENSEEAAWALPTLQASIDSTVSVGTLTAIGHSSSVEGSLLQFSLPVATDSSSQIGSSQIGSSQIGSSQIGSSQISSSQIGSSQISSSQIGKTHSSPPQIGFTEIGFFQIGLFQRSSTEVSAAEVDLSQKMIREISFTEVSAAEVGSLQSVAVQDSSLQIDSWQASSDQFSSQFDFAKIPFPISIAFQQLFGSHDFSSQNTTTWTDLLGADSPLDLTFEIQDLPIGQIAETQITRFDSQGRPIAGTILIDDDANGTGWFIDPTPWESSEFSLHNTEYNFQATPDSIAYGRYDLLTTILHELGHLAGFIAGHDRFDDHVHNHTFTDGDLTAALTADGSHLTDPLRLLSPYLTPGMRKLPSELELRILEAIRNHDGSTHAHGPITAAQTATPLVGITNGDFEQLLNQWNHRGTVQPSAFNTSTAVTLTEDSLILSQLSQTFVIPQDASQRYLTFDLLETTLGSTTHRPPDAFEVALLDSTTLKPLVGTAIGLTNTDALLNLQSNGTLYLDDDVTVTTLANGHRRVRIDLGDLAPSTTATLYFDLLGFGAADSRITIDNITFGKGSTPPVATDDTATLTQGQSTPLNLLTNDTADQPLTPSQLTLATNPTHGSLTRDEQGNLIYNPFDGYAGIDSFTYRLTSSDGETSNLATVNLEILNAAPQIQTIALPNTATEGTPLSFTAAATDPGNDTLTYTWTFSDGSTPLTGQIIAHTFY